MSAQVQIDRLLAQNQGLQGKYDALLQELRRTQQQLTLSLSSPPVTAQTVTISSSMDIKHLRDLNPYNVKQWTDQFKANSNLKPLDLMSHEVIEMIDCNITAMNLGYRMDPPWQRWSPAQLCDWLRKAFPIEKDAQHKTLLQRIESFTFKYDPVSADPHQQSLLRLTEIVRECSADDVRDNQKTAISKLVKKLRNHSSTVLNRIAEFMGASDASLLPLTLKAFMVMLLNEINKAHAVRVQVEQYTTSTSKGQ